MKNIIKLIFKYLFLLLIGGIIYYSIEIVYRGYSHWTMILVGGLCFVCYGLLNEFMPWDTLMWLQMFFCSIITTIIEYISGIILNKILFLDVWDYSNLPLNINGQVCLYFSIIWFFISPAGIILDDYIRYYFFSEEKPRYRWK